MDSNEVASWVQVERNLKPKSLLPPNLKIKKEGFCFKCRCSINQFGVILFSPPKNNIVTKYHLCDKCFKSIIVCKKSMGMFQM